MSRFPLNPEPPIKINGMPMIRKAYQAALQRQSNARPEEAPQTCYATDAGNKSERCDCRRVQGKVEKRIITIAGQIPPPYAQEESYTAQGYSKLIQTRLVGMEQMNRTVFGMFHAQRWLGTCFSSFTAITIDDPIFDL